MNATPIQVPLLIPAVPDRSALWPYLERIDEARHYTNFGPLVKELEARLQQRFESHAGMQLHVTTVSNATLGIELTLKALNLPAGSLVLVPALTFVATITAIISAGHIPVVADIDPDNWLLTPEIAAAAVKASGARAAVVVATFGHPQNTRDWSEFQRQSGVRIVIDAAAAFGSQWLDAGDIPVVFSMHATKSLPAGEGGFIVSGDASINALVCQMSNFGINLDPHSGVPVGYLSSSGTNAKLSEFHAAVGLASLDNWDQQALLRQRLYQRYRSNLEQSCGEELSWQTGPAPSAPTTFCVRLGSEARRTHFEILCREQGIATRRWYQPLLHRHAPEIGKIVVLPTPHAEAVAADLIGLPFFIDISDAQIASVAAAVRRSVSLNPLLQHVT
ncbi:DegT/DnrJ/EryC1/StrS family aminotransferase [Collimonas humicola]|uniref:DegT/DnrJ/EryC1/StrS family aminotransferase n=1 Tax=Collimonas humicola TaxID=2825886 RepID=UPI001B8ABFFA|nr:DegT/DnrJ/EryC1/StrS family aminotransferase [Collimonas humicola]